MRNIYFWQITFSLYRLSVLALPRATESHRRKGKNGREGPAVACFRYCTLPPEREPSLSAHPSPPCCKSPSPSGTWRKEWPSPPLFRLEPPPEPPPWICTPWQPPCAPGWAFRHDHCYKWRDTCNAPGRAFGSGSRQRVRRTRDYTNCLLHPSDGVVACRAIGAVSRRRGDVPL